MNDFDKAVQAIFAEFERLGLKLEDSPYSALSGDGGGVEQFLARLQMMQPGVTWRDVYPDMPADWVPGRPETWRTPYKPFGSFDYPTPPAGPAFYVLWPEPGAGPRHDGLVQRARDAGWPVHGGGIAPDRRPGNTDDLGFIVLKLGTPEEVLDQMLEWILRQPGVEHSRLYRTEDEEWV
jgi:hypothetical protein